MRAVTVKNLAIITLAVSLLASSAPAGNLIRKACLKAARPGTTRQLCGCIQKVADIRLKGRKNQKLAASFFADPHQAQVIRQSDRRSHEAFWTSYKAWGAAAEATCAEDKG